jgi:hypothetical protein
MLGRIDNRTDNSAAQSKLDQRKIAVRCNSPGYDYNKGLSNHSKCLLGQFLNDHGIERPYVGAVTWNDCSGPEHGDSYYIPKHIDDIARGSSAYRRDDWTFGNALARAYLK